MASVMTFRCSDAVGRLGGGRISDGHAARHGEQGSGVSVCGFLGRIHAKLRGRIERRGGACSHKRIIPPRRTGEARSRWRQKMSSRPSCESWPQTCIWSTGGGGGGSRELHRANRRALR